MASSKTRALVGESIAKVKTVLARHGVDLFIDGEFRTSEHEGALRFILTGEENNQTRGLIQAGGFERPCRISAGAWKFAEILSQFPSKMLVLLQPGRK